MNRLVVALGLAVCLLLPAAAHARDNTTHALAVGFQTVPVQPVFPPGVLSLKFAAAPTAEFAVLLGTQVQDGFFALSFGGKALLVLVPEEHVNLYVTAMVLPTVGSDGLHTFSYFVGPGLAFYLPGAENLELFAEFGLGGAVHGAGSTIPTPPSLVTTGSLTLGLHYWF